MNTSKSYLQKVIKCSPYIPSLLKVQNIFQTEKHLANLILHPRISQISGLYDPEQMLFFLLIIYFCLSEHAHTQLHAENLVYDVGSDIAGQSSLETGVPRRLGPS